MTKMICWSGSATEGAATAMDMDRIAEALDKLEFVEMAITLRGGGCPTFGNESGSNGLALVVRESLTALREELDIPLSVSR